MHRTYSCRSVLGLSRDDGEIGSVCFSTVHAQCLVSESTESVVQRIRVMQAPPYALRDQHYRDFSRV